MESQSPILKTESAYLRSIRASITGLWRSQISPSDFQSSMLSAITRAYNQAAIEGAKQCGISVDEMTDEELKKVQELIENEKQWIDGLAGDIVENNQANGGKLNELIYRANYWASRYEQVKQAIKMMACADKKYRWQYGDTRHCSSCLDLNGRVYRGKVWANYIQPRSSQLACFGIHCQCQLIETDERITSGKPPRIKGPKRRR